MTRPRDAIDPVSASAGRAMIPAMADSDDLQPPWAKHPEISWGSVGWRMGYGESWLMRWQAWLGQQPVDRAWREAYLRRHPPAPRSWANVVAEILEPPGDPNRDDDDSDENVEDAVDGGLAKRLADEGWLGDDVAMDAWEALHGEHPEAPWVARWHAGELGPAARYGARQLTFWARWCARRREDGRLDAWLREVPEPGPAWAPVHDAIRRGEVSPTGNATSSWERIAWLIAAHAEAPPPWSLGEPPTSFRDAYTNDSSYADAWCSWAYDVFDDDTSWRAYLERHGGVPAAWADIIEESITIGF